MAKKIEEQSAIRNLTLALLYLSGWEEDSRIDPDEKIFRSWKGYLFDVLNDLMEEGMINQFMNLKSVIIKPEGIKEAKEIVSRCLIGLKAAK